MTVQPWNHNHVRTHDVPHGAAVPLYPSPPRYAVYRLAIRLVRSTRVLPRRVVRLGDQSVFPCKRDRRGIKTLWCFPFLSFLSYPQGSRLPLRRYKRRAYTYVYNNTYYVNALTRKSVRGSLGRRVEGHVHVTDDGRPKRNDSVCLDRLFGVTARFSPLWPLTSSACRNTAILKIHCQCPPSFTYLSSCR